MKVNKVLNWLGSLLRPRGADRCVEKPNQDAPIVILDVGCRWGFAERFLGGSGIAVFGFDPDRAECERLKDRYQGQPVTLVPLGLAGREGTRTLYITREPACSSLIEPDPEKTSGYPALNCALREGVTEVHTTTLDLWSKRQGLDHADYIKVDTQGSELEILQGGEHLLESVRALEVEVEFNPIYSNQPLFADVDRYLRSRGFALWKFSNWVHYSRHPETNEPIGVDRVHFDETAKSEYPVYGGQVHWANAHYIRGEVLKESDPVQVERDTRLFELLGMSDVLRDRVTPSGAIS